MGRLRFIETEFELDLSTSAGQRKYIQDLTQSELGIEQFPPRDLAERERAQVTGPLNSSEKKQTNK